MIKLININKFYQSGSERFHALKDVNLAFGEHGMTFILGKSGSGKSTLLNIIGGLDNYDSGQFIVDEIDTCNYSSQHYNTYRNTYVGFVFQEFNVLKGLSVWDNIALSIQLQHVNVKKDEAKKEIQKIIDQVGLTGLEKRMMNQISGGQRQRVAIARALIKKPRIIIADEPTGNLDGKNSKIIMDLLKELSREHLILIVTHSDSLAHTYADRTIFIKDGITSEISESAQLQEQSSNRNLGLIKVPIKSSIFLANKSFIKNKLRFIVMIVLFALALTFAGVVVNLSSVDTAKIYAQYQEDYGSFSVNVNKKYTSYNVSTTTAFFNHEISSISTTYTDKSEYLNTLTGMDYYIPINTKNLDKNSFFADTIQRVHIYEYETLSRYRLLYGSFGNVANNYTTIITDYLAKALIHYQYFDGVSDIKDLINKEITADYFKNSLKIVGIIETNYNEFLPYFENNSSDTKYTAAFEDNLIFYSSLFVTSNPNSLSGSTYEHLYSNANIKYFYDKVIYNALDRNGISDEPVRFSLYNEVFNNNYSAATDGKEPLKNIPGEQTQIALSTGYFEKVLGIKLNPGDLKDEAGNTISAADAYFNKVYFRKSILQADGSYKEVSLYSNNALIGISRVPSSLTFFVTTVVENDEAVVYTPSDGELFGRILSNSYGMGSFITLINTASASTSNSNSYTDSVTSNAAVFAEMIDNDMIISNKSFTKILLVHNFIEDNLWLFFGIFFVFGLFSVLLIFNFVIVSIKNSTRDIGIYMSLGMSGFKISLIYFFQVMLMGIISFVAATISMTIFLLVLDANFTAMSAVNLPIIKITALGIIAVLGISILVPNLAIILPLYNLSKKHPIDVIKSA